MKMDYDDSTGADCPKCSHSMLWLRDYVALDVNEGYTMDDDDDSFRPGFRMGLNPVGLLVRALVHGTRLVFRNVVRPAAAKKSGDKLKVQLAETLRVFPKSMICSHCKHVVRDK